MTTATVRGLVVVLLALAVAACTSPTVVSTMPQVMKIGLPVVDLSATPAGWVPVAFGDAQISVPEPSQPRRSLDRFIVLYGAGQYCSSVPLRGTLYVGSRLPRSGCSGTVVAMDQVPEGALQRR